ncbi:MAG: fibronectin type III domain-containing protein [Gammaproteobacteria bacterium]|nr:fibronectin type III domain-containing protein [Gammaproteobacteria bacterium]
MKNYIISTMLIIMSLTLIGCGGNGEGAGNSATLTWTAPTTRMDGSFVPMSEIAGYRVYMGATPDSITLVDEVVDPYTMEYQFSALDSGTYYFSVTALDTDDQESDIPEPVSKTFI